MGAIRGGRAALPGVCTDDDDTAAEATIGDVSGCADSIDTQVRAVLGRVLAQRWSAEAAFGYVEALAPGVKANCWQLAEAAGHESPYRLQALLSSYRWDWRQLRSELAALARQWLPCDEDDLIGPGIAFDETAQLKDGDATACAAPRHAGCTGHVENCVTTVFSAYVTTSGQARADFDVFMPRRWATDTERRRAAGIGDGLTRRTKPRLAEDQLERLWKAGLPLCRAAFDEVCGRSSELRGACEAAGLPYVAIIPRDFRITLQSGAVIKAEDALTDALFERRSCGDGSKGPRFSDRALTATASARHFLLIRRLLSRPDHPAFYLCRAPEETPATMTFFITIAGRRWPARRRSRPERTSWAGTSHRPVPGTGSAGTPPSPRSPSSATSPSATARAATSRPRPHPPPATTTTARPTMTRRRSVTLTCSYPSGMRPSPPCPGSPARPASARSS